MGGSTLEYKKKIVIKTTCGAHVLHDGLADTKYRPCPLLTKYVEAGWEEKLREVFMTIQAKSQYHRDRFNHLNPTLVFFLATTS